MFNIARNALLGKAATKDAESQGSQESATSDGPSCGHLLLARVWGSVAAIRKWKACSIRMFAFGTDAVFSYTGL